jgi:hypothetical protein
MPYTRSVILLQFVITQPDGWVRREGKAGPNRWNDDKIRNLGSVSAKKIFIFSHRIVLTLMCTQPFCARWNPSATSSGVLISYAYLVNIPASRTSCRPIVAMPPLLKSSSPDGPHRLPHQRQGSRGGSNGGSCGVQGRERKEGAGRKRWEMGAHGDGRAAMDGQRRRASHLLYRSYIAIGSHQVRARRAPTVVGHLSIVFVYGRARLDDATTRMLACAAGDRRDWA